MISVITYIVGDYTEQTLYTHNLALLHLSYCHFFVILGIYGVPLQKVGQAMWDAVERYTKHITSVKSATLKEIHFVNNDKKTNDFLTVFFCKKVDPNEEYSFSEDENDTYHDASQDPPGSDRVGGLPRDSGRNRRATSSVHTIASHNRVSSSPSSNQYTNVTDSYQTCSYCYQCGYNLKRRHECVHFVCRKCESQMCRTCTSTTRYLQQSFGNVNPTGMHAIYPMHNHF